MILSDLSLLTKKYLTESVSGIDSIEHCPDKDHFKNFKYPVTYNYNSRGFRCEEWPESIDELKSAVWCLGDSFTVGIGSPYNHTWHKVLRDRSGKLTINISMDGASNEWISSTAIKICNEIKPSNMALMWTYTHRRRRPPGAKDLRDSSKSKLYLKEWWDAVKNDPYGSHDNNADFQRLFTDFHQVPLHVRKNIAEQYLGDDFVVSEDLMTFKWKNEENVRLHYIDSTDDEDIQNFSQCVTSLLPWANQINFIHSTVPLYAPAGRASEGHKILREHYTNVVPYFKSLDLARDSHHFDIVTSQYIADSMVGMLA